MAEDQGFPPSSGHDLNPLRLFSSRVLFQILECSDMVDLYFVHHAGYSALLTGLGEEPFL